MAHEYLQAMVADVSYDDLPPAWNTFDLKSFSRDKQLWDYQQAALRHALVALQRYYDEWADYRPGESADAGTRARKTEYLNWYRRNGLTPDDLEIVLRNNTIKNRELIALLAEFYAPAREEALQVYTRVYFSYRDFINRMCFWMATGSGKTLILIKLIELLKRLIDRREIPDHDILVLTYRDDLIAQIKAHVQEFNAEQADLSIRLYELKAYEEIKYGQRPLPNELPVFYYRSDNLSDVAGQKILDFRSYENGGRWYVLLDEAHKGDRDESKRQHIYSILSRAGFLFNFSATFTDPRDVATTVFNFNLAEFIRAGYGKHIAVLKQEIRAFRAGEDYTDEEKQKVVLKSLLMLAYVRQFLDDLRGADTPLYHSDWLTGELVGYEINETFEDESYFERLDDDESAVNILMGSRTFYEGWDSNRPNVMNFINIGMGTDARKFILQSIGRGVRIEPLPNVRRRLLPLVNAGEVPAETFEPIATLDEPRALPIETLFIFGTNRSALQSVIGHLDRVGRKPEEHTLQLERNEAAEQHRLLIPVFKRADHLLAEETKLRKFEVAPEERDLLRAYVEALDDRLLLARYEAEPKRIAWLRRSFEEVDSYYRPAGKAVRHLGLLARRALDYFGVVPQEFEQYCTSCCK